MCRHQHLLYSCGCRSALPIYTGCPPDRCHGSWVDRTPKRMNHPCAGCAYRTQQRATAFDDGSNAARRESVRRWESTRRRPSTTHSSTRRPSGLTRLLTSGFGERDRSRSVSADRRPQMSYRTQAVSPPPLRQHRHGHWERDTSAEDEMMQYSSEENDYTIRYNRDSGEWSSVASPRRHRRHRRHRD